MSSEDAVLHDVRLTALSDIHAHPQNYREHPDDQLEHLAQSIREHGFYRNVVVANDGTILAGHGIVEAARRLGMTAVPVAHLTLAPDDPKALKILAGDNELGRLAEIDDRQLSVILKQIQETDPIGLLGTGYDEMMLAALVLTTRPASEIATMDEAAHWVGMPEYEAGDKLVKLILNFETSEARDEFVTMIGGDDFAHKRVGEPNKEVWILRWPLAGREDPSAFRFGVGEDDTSNERAPA